MFNIGDGDNGDEDRVKYKVKSSSEFAPLERLRYARKDADANKL